MTWTAVYPLLIKYLCPYERRGLDRNLRERDSIPAALRHLTHGVYVMVVGDADL
jgi:hypothetical protein